MRSPNTAVRLFGLAALAAAGALGCTAQQPPIGCPVQSLTWAATYRPKPTTTCPLKYGEQLGIQKYGLANEDERLTVKPTTLAEIDERDPAHLPYSIGPLPRQAGQDDLCAVPSLSVAEKHAEADPAQGLPAVDITYRWSNVRVLAKPEAPGTQLVADLQYTEAGCTADYEVWALWPGDVSCANALNAPDDALCRTSESLNPDFATVCDPHLLLCVPAQRPPSFR
jgi:hypothetical protein